MQWYFVYFPTIVLQLHSWTSILRKEFVNKKSTHISLQVLDLNVYHSHYVESATECLRSVENSNLRPPNILSPE